MNDYSTILQGIAQLLNNYASTYRGNVEFHRYNTISRYAGDKGLSFSDETIREPLLCHVGHLPVIASYFYQFLKNKDTVDLGDTLVMLAIHDIGETIAGDVVTIAVDRTDDIEKKEKEAAISLLNKQQYMTYLEYENPTTNSGRFAKSVDKLSGVLMCYCTPAAIERSRLEYFGFSVKDIRKKYSEYMKRDSFLEGFFEALLTELEKKLGNAKS